MLKSVLIVGAGPTGLVTAIELVRLGLSVRIIDKNQGPSDKSKALAIQARSLEIFDQLGIIKPFLEQGMKIKAANLWSHSERLAHIEMNSIDSPYPFVLSLEQSRTETILLQYLSSLGVEVERGVELISFEQRPDSVEVVLSNGVTTAEWLIGADGAHSTIRKTLNLSFEGMTFAKSFSLADVRIDWKLPQKEVSIFLNGEGVLAVIPLPEPGRYRVVFEGPATIDAVEKLLKQHTSVHTEVSEPHWITEFAINSRMVEKYFEGRVFIAGDAAHIHSPAGGQGMNTGFQDVDNLAWKLALVHEGMAKRALLDTYDLERRQVAKGLLHGTEGLTGLVTMKNSIGRKLRNWLISTLAKRAFFQRHFTGLLSQTKIHYTKNLAVGEGGGMLARNLPIDQMRGKKAFFLLSHDAKLRAELHSSEVIAMEIEGPHHWIIRPDMYVGCKSRDPAHIKAYLSNFMIH